MSTDLGEVDMDGEAGLVKGALWTQGGVWSMDWRKIPIRQKRAEGEVRMMMNLQLFLTSAVYNYTDIFYELLRYSA